MKRTTLIAVGLLLIPASSAAQTTMIEQALMAAPARAREAAAVVKWNADHTYETLKEGTSRLVCYDRSDERDRPAFAVQCTSVGNLERVAQNRRLRAQTEDGAGERAMLAELEASGDRVLPEYGSVWYAFSGADAASARLHMTIAVPGATGESTGLPENGRQGGAYVMAAGTTSAHIMIPGG